MVGLVVPSTVPPIVIALVELETFLIAHALPPSPTALGAVIVNPADVGSALTSSPTDAVYAAVCVDGCTSHRGFRKPCSHGRRYLPAASHAPPVNVPDVAPGTDDAIEASDVRLS